MTVDFAGGRLTIDLGALQDNWRALAAISPRSECAAVVKANAYGIGTREATRALAAAGAGTFFVAHPSEARAAREAAPDAVVYVLNGLAPGACDLLASLRARPVLGSREEIAEWAGFVASTGADAAAAVHIDTGMIRLGLDPDEARSMLAAGLGFEPSLLMSHLACADEPERPETESQRALFAELRALAPGLPASLANSAGTLRPSTGAGDLAFDMRRPGVSLYGSMPIMGHDFPLRPVVGLEARVIQVREASVGDKVGYGGAQRLTRASRLAILSLGYADGIFRAGGSEDGSSGATGFVDDVPCPFVGRISMDLIAVDVTDAGGVKRGDWIEILGRHVGVDDLAKASGTIGYEVLTSIGRRFERAYVG